MIVGVYILLLPWIGGMFVLALVLGVALVSGWRPTDARDILVNNAFHKVLLDGVRLEGVRLGPFGRLVILLLARKDDTRIPLVFRATTHIAADASSEKTPEAQPALVDS